MTLTEFLLARIDEDEAVVLRAFEATNELFGRGGETDTGIDVVYDSAGPFVGVGNERMVAEIAAKRIIIASEVAAHVGRRDEYKDSATFDAIASRVNTRALRALAVIYADHPDYREEWRP